MITGEENDPGEVVEPTSTPIDSTTTSRSSDKGAEKSTGSDAGDIIAKCPILTALKSKSIFHLI